MQRHGGAESQEWVGGIYESFFLVGLEGEDGEPHVKRGGEEEASHEGEFRNGMIVECEFEEKYGA